MANELNPLNISNPEEEVGSLYLTNPVFTGEPKDQSLFELNPVFSGEPKDQSLFELNPVFTGEPKDQSLFKLEPNATLTRSSSVKKSTAKVSLLAATLVGSAVGIVTVINPLTTRPSVTNGKYLFEGNTLTYSFKLTTLSNYKCKLILYYDKANKNIINQELQLEKAQNYEGSFVVTEAGEYELTLFATNNVDYKKETSLYKFKYLGV